MKDRLDTLCRRTEASLPGEASAPVHGAEMVGFLWRVTDVRSSRVILVRCGVHGHPDGDWATVAIAAEPGGFVRSGVLPLADAERDAFVVTAGAGALRATATEVHIDLGDDASVDVAIGVAVVSGSVTLGAERWDFSDAELHAERYWGADLPARSR